MASSFPMTRDYLMWRLPKGDPRISEDLEAQRQFSITSGMGDDPAQAPSFEGQQWAADALNLMDQYGVSSATELPAEVRAQLPNQGIHVSRGPGSLGRQAWEYITSPPVLMALGGAYGMGAFGGAGAGGGAAAGASGAGGSEALGSGISTSAQGAQGLSTTAQGASGLSLTPEAVAAFNSGIGLPFAAGVGAMTGSGSATGVPATAQTGGAGAQPAGQQLGSGIQAPNAPAGGAPAPAGGIGAPAGQAGTGLQAGAQPSFVDSVIAQMKNNALQLGIMGAGMMMSDKSSPMPNEEQINALGQESAATARQLMEQYRSGNLSPGQQASMDQMTQQAKNQITNYFASIGQADSTAHMQALQQVDQTALQMKQQMLDTALQQGLQAVGIAQGPLNTVAQYQLGQDQRLTQAFGNFANAAGTLFGRSAGTPSQQTASVGVNVTGQ